MEVKEVQKLVKELEDKIMSKDSFEYPQLLRSLKVMEELGEVSDVLIRLLVKSRKGDKLKIEEVKEELGFEIVDTLIPLIGIANQYNINLEEVIKKKLETHNKRYE